MSQRSVVDLLLLGALWGASFLFMRMGAAEFGPAPLVFLRVAGASLFLLPLLALRGHAPAMGQHWRAIAMVGVLNSAIPFMLFMVAALVLSAGLMAVFNATTPIWGALVGWLWLKDKPAPQRLLGLAIGLAGVVGLSWGKADFKAGALGVSPAVGIAACVAAAMFYGVAGHLSRRTLNTVPPLAVATGTQLSATLVLALPAWWAWPAALPSAQAWWAAAALAVACTGLAYVLYFRLMASAGATVAMSVTFLIPAYAMLWGWLFLGERPTATMLVGGAVILFGTALATGLLRLPGKAASTAKR
jgi:drug/metabolite transporter (DMT)-like permease